MGFPVSCLYMENYGSSNKKDPLDKTKDFLSNFVSFYQWLECLDKTRTTGWRWRKNGYIKVINIFGKLYISRDEIAQFEQRAIAGEFHRDGRNPRSGMQPE